MTDTRESEQAADHALRQDLAQADHALAGVAPVLGHLLASTGQALVSEDLVARMRGMLSDLSEQIIRIAADSGSASHQLDQTAIEAFSGRLATSSILVSHCYALAMESQIAEQLEQRSGIDQVLTPLLQELIASTDESIAELAMATMSAQARFVQAQRRMDLPLGELPAELFHAVLTQWQTHDSKRDKDHRERVVTTARNRFDEGASRLGLLTRLVGSMGNALRATLDLEPAGFALFASGLARSSRQPRELAVLSCHEQQAVRLALALRASGLGTTQLREQFLLIHSELALPSGMDEIGAETAKAMLAGTTTRGGA